jgi:hypothetical protein
MSLLDPIIAPIVRKEVRNVMKDSIQMVLDLIKSLVQPEKGTKFLVTLACIGAIYYMHTSAISNNTSDMVIGGVAVAYYIADYARKSMTNGNGGVK